MSEQYFSDAEWQSLLNAPFQAIMAVILSDKTDPVNFLKEVRAAAQILETEVQRDDIGNDIVRSLLKSLRDVNTQSGLPTEALMRQREYQFIDGMQQFKNAPEGLKSVEASLAQVAGILASKVSVVQAQEFKQWVLALAQQVAMAVKEGGILGGFGGEVISKDEHAALKRIEQVFEFKV